MNEGIFKILSDRYFLKNESSWEDIAKRVSSIYKPIYNFILNMVFIPSSPTLMNANTLNENIGTLSSCFPMEIKDSIEGIFESLKEAAIVTKFSGGIGYDFSILRSSKEGVLGIGGKNSSGPLPFIQIYDAMLDGVQQGGKRRGAGMALLSIEHPDILQFIMAKDDITKTNRFNFSVKIPSSFYKKLEKEPDSIHIVKNVKDSITYELKDNDDNAVTTKQLWDLIIKQAWKKGEPGIFNQDIAIERCSVANISTNVILNPCSEFTNIPYTSCSLGSINLCKLIDNDKFDWDSYEKIIVDATLFLNNVIDVNKYPIKKIAEVTKKSRPIGLGIMGLAHLFYKLSTSYDSEEACKLTEDIIRYLTMRSMQQSVELAKEFGSYEYFDYETFMNANKRFFTRKKCRNIDVEQLQKDIKKYGIRNSSLTSIAPTGSISTIGQTSSGIEPVFALTYQRKVEKLNKEYDILYITDSVFEEYLINTFDEKKKKIILEEISNNKGSCQNCKDISSKIKKIFVVAGDLSPKAHLDVLVVAANNVSLSVSKTINIHNDAKEEEISKVFLAAHERGVIGITVYRDGCREGILVHNTNGSGIVERHAPKRPKSLPCHLYRITVQGAPWLVFVGLYKDHPYEVFAGKVDLVDIPSNITSGDIIKLKRGVYQFEVDGEAIIKDIGKIFDYGWEESLTRQLSTNLRHGTPIDFIVDQLSKSSGSVSDFSKAIARALKKYMKEKTLKDTCPVCSSILKFEDTCISCANPECSWSKCG